MGFRLFIPGNSFDFTISRLFFVCVFLDVENWDFLKSYKIFPFLDIPEVQIRS